MKRSLVFLGLLALFVAGCGGSGSSSSSNTTTGSQAGSGKKIGLVTDIGGLNARGFTPRSYPGPQPAGRGLGGQPRVFQAKSTQESVPIRSRFPRQGYVL